MHLFLRGILVSSFSFLVLPLVFVSENVELIKAIKNCYFVFCFLKEILYNWCYFFDKCLMEFTSTTISTWKFSPWKAFGWKLSSLIVIGLFRLSTFSWECVGNFCLFFYDF